MINLYLNITFPSPDSWARPIFQQTVTIQQQNMLINLETSEEEQVSRNMANGNT